MRAVDPGERFGLSGVVAAEAGAPRFQCGERPGAFAGGSHRDQPVDRTGVGEEGVVRRSIASVGRFAVANPVPDASPTMTICGRMSRIAVLPLFGV